jgi:hypothetical protein
VRRLLHGIVWLIGVCAIAYVYFFVPVGQRTLYQHTVRIAATEPAQELGGELEQVGEDVSDRAQEEWRGRRSP